MEARRHSGLALARAWTGIVAAETVLGMRLRSLLAGEAGGQEGRNGGKPE
jgi:hypothetical protein